MMSVNEILRDDITKINYKLMPSHFKGNIRDVRFMQENLARLIDLLGEQSAAAQGLNRIITTADKLRNSPSHYLYLLKDSTAKAGKGEVIAMLKVGCKHLFLFDERDKVCEVEPLCVLDFFVQPNRQRTGLGKLLFDYMLVDMKKGAIELAIDGPSSKMELFLRKNYNIDVLMRQNNNFAVCPEFFDHNPVISTSKSRRCPLLESPAVGRFAAHKPQSAIATVGMAQSITPPDMHRWQSISTFNRVIHGTASVYDENWENVIFGEVDSKMMKKANRVKESVATPPAPSEPKEEPKAEPESKPEPQAEPEPNVAAKANNTKSPERPSTLSVEPVSDNLEAAPAVSPAGSTTSRRDSQLTEQGFFDVKFYHNKLW